MRYIISLAFVLLNSVGFAQTDFIAVASGNWNASGTWSTDGFTPISCAPCIAGTDYPGGGDDAWTNGFAITVNSAQAVRDIMVEDVAGSLVFAGQLTVNGALVGWSGGQFGFASDITTNVLSGTSNFLFTANDLSNAGEFNLFNSEVIGFWNNNAPISVARFQLSQTASIDAGFSGGNIRFTSQFNLISGNLTTGFFLSGLEIGSQFILGANTNFSTTVPIYGISGVSSNVTIAIINSGAIFELATSNSYINSATFRLLGTSIFNVAFSGTDQQQGWWYQTSSPTTTTIQSGSTIIFGATSDQNIPALTVGNLYLQGSGIKTLGSSGTLIVQGNLLINSASITFNTSSNLNPIDVSGNLDNNGTWSPSQLVIFGGTTSQTIGGNNAVSYGGGIRIENTSATVSLNNIGADVNDIFDIDLGATFNPSDQVVNMSGNMIVDGTLSAGTDPSGFTFDGTTSFLGSGSRNFNDVTITGTVTAPSGTLNIAGDFTDNGTFTASSGTINFNGTQAQSIGGSSATSFNNVNITKSSTTNTVTVSTAKNLVGIITLSANSAFNANGNLTLVSDASGDATVAAIPASAIFSGNVIYQRYISVGENRWANIGFPMSTAVSNISAGGFTTGGSLYTYDETELGNVDTGWVEETSSLSTGQGYTLYQYTGQSGGTVNSTGLLNTGDVNIPLTFSNSGDALADGWNFVSNPYASTLDWGSVTKSGIVTTAKVWNGSTYSELVDAGNISSGQGFWVQATTNTTLTLTQNDKVNTSQALQRSSEDNWLKLIVTDENDESDIAHVRFRESATEEFDPLFDSYKFVNAIHNLSTMSEGGLDLAVNTVPFGDCSRSVNVKINQANGSYDLRIDGLGTLTAGYEVTLVDNYINTTVKFNQSTVYSFDVDENEPATFGTERFDLVFNSILLDDSVQPTYAVSDDCYNAEASITLNDVQDGLTYHIEDGNGLTLSNEVVASNGSALVSLNKSALSANTPYQLTVIGTADNECSGTLTYTELVDYEFASVPEITNTVDAEVCNGFEGSIVLKAEGAPKFGSYRWYLDATTTEPIAGANLSYLEIASLSEAKQSYFVSALNEAGCEGQRVEVKVNTYNLTKPTVEPASGCLGGNVTLNALGADDNGYYRWYTSMESTTPIADENSSLLTVENLNTGTSYYVSIVNSNGCESSRVKANIDLFTLAEPAVTGASTCSGGNVTLSASGASGAGYYRWYTSMESTAPIVDENSSTLLVENLMTSKVYYVSIVNSNGCESERKEVLAGVEVLEAPKLTVAGTILSVPTGFTYQWYLNQEIIEGAVNNSIEVKSTGVYSVVISNGSCQATSDSRQMVVTGIDDILYDLGLNIYPNPVSDKLYFKHKDKSFKFTLFDLKGNTILNDNNLVNNLEISYFDMSNLNAGFYILNVELNNGSTLPIRVLKK